MSQREYAEDTIWWSIKDATEFAPHRRTIVLFHTNTSSLAGKPNPLRWVDNTGQAWPELRRVLLEYHPEKIAINIDRNIAFSGGLHVGEWAVLHEQLGDGWMERAINRPMIAIEYVASRVPGQLKYYRMMQETTWALVEEAFSNRVIQPGKTNTEVRNSHRRIQHVIHALTQYSLAHCWNIRTSNGGSAIRCGLRIEGQPAAKSLAAERLSLEYGC